MNMELTSDKLKIIADAKTDIKSAIIEMGGTVNDYLPSYGNAIRALPTGGGGDEGLTGDYGLYYKNNNISYLKAYAFYLDSIITSIEMNNVKSLGTYAIYSCRNLNSIKMDNVMYMSDGALYYNNGLSELSFPKLKYMGDYCFNYANGALRVNCPNLYYIGRTAMQSISKCTYFSVSDKLIIKEYGLTYASLIPFSHFPSITVLCSSNAVSSVLLPNFNSLCLAYSIPDAKTTTDLTGDWYGIASNVASGNKSLTNVSLSNAIYIGVYAFTYCSNITNLNIENVLVIDSSAFISCSAISHSLNLPHCEFIFENAFNNCRKIADTLSLPACVKIGTSAFQSCYSLRSLYLPTCVEISYGAFNYCSSISNIYAPELKTISSAVFNRCVSLRSVDLSKVEYLGDQAFSLCSMYLSVVKLSKCSFIGSSAFYGCYKLSSIYLTSPNLSSSLNPSMFRYCNSSLKIYVNSEFYDKYYDTYRYMTVSLSLATKTFGSILVRYEG